MKSITIKSIADINKLLLQLNAKISLSRLKINKPADLYSIAREIELQLKIKLPPFNANDFLSVNALFDIIFLKMGGL